MWRWKVQPSRLGLFVCLCTLPDALQGGGFLQESLESLRVTVWSWLHWVPLRLHVLSWRNSLTLCVCPSVYVVVTLAGCWSAVDRVCALQPLNDHPVRSDWSTLWRGRVRNLPALPDLSVEDSTCLAGSYPIWNSRRIVEADTKNPANQLLSLHVTVWLLLLFVFFCTYQLICF